MRVTRSVIFKPQKKVNKILKKIVDKIRILTTPLNPQYVKILSIFCLIITTNSKAQDLPSNHLLRDTLTTVEKTRIAIQIKNEVEAGYQLEEHSELKKYEWTKFLPHLGYSSLSGFNVNYDFLNVFKFLTDRKVKEAKRSQIWDLYQKKAQEEFNEYLIIIEERNYLQVEIKQQTEIIELERRLFEISRMKYENHEITPTEYLGKEITIKSKELQLIRFNLQLDKLNREIKSIEDLKLKYTDVY